MQAPYKAYTNDLYTFKIFPYTCMNNYNTRYDLSWMELRKLCCLHYI